MLSGNASSPPMAHVNLHPYSSSGSSRRRTSIHSPATYHPATSSSSRRDSLHSNDMLIGSDGELHDPGYHDSLKTLRAEIEAASALHSAAFPSSLQRKATMNSAASKSRRGSLAPGQHIPPPFLLSRAAARPPQTGSPAEGELSSSEEEPDEDDHSILNEQRRRAFSSTGHSSPFSSPSLSSSFASTSALSAPSGTPRRRAMTSNSNISSASRDLRFNCGLLGPPYTDSLPRKSFEHTEELVYEAPPLPSASARKPGSSLRSSFSLANPSALAPVLPKRSSSAHPSAPFHDVDAWHGGFTSLVDVQQAANLQGHRDDSSTFVPPRAVSFTSVEPIRRGWPHDMGKSSHQPGYEDVNDLRRGSITSLTGISGGNVRQSSASKAVGKPRSSSDGSTRGQGSKRWTEMIASTGISLRQKRSESDPSQYRAMTMHRGVVDPQPQNRISEPSRERLFSTGYRPVAHLTPSAGGVARATTVTSGPSASLRDDRDEGSDLFLRNARSSSVAKSISPATLPHNAEEVAQIQLPDLHYPGQHPSPYSPPISFSSEGEAAAPSRKPQPQRPSLASFLSSTAANDSIISSSQSTNSSFSQRKTPVTPSKAEQAAPSNETVRRKMQRFGLGMRFKAFQAEKKFKNTFGNGSGGESTANGDLARRG